MKDRWKNRRAMAWIALIVGCVYPFAVLFSDSTGLAEIAASVYLFLSAIVGAYIGFATLDDKWQPDEKEKDLM
jgi:hypothetical protein